MRITNPLKFYNTAGDADWNVRDLAIDDTQRKYSGYPFNFLATSAYRMLYWTKSMPRTGTTYPVKDL